MHVFTFENKGASKYFSTNHSTVRSIQLFRFVTCIKLRITFHYLGFIYFSNSAVKLLATYLYGDQRDGETNRLKSDRVTFDTRYMTKGAITCHV